MPVRSQGIGSQQKHLASDPVGLGLDPRMCISNELLVQGPIWRATILDLQFPATLGAQGNSGNSEFLNPCASSEV